MDEIHTMASIVTSEDLRHELQRFADNNLRSQLLELQSGIEKTLREELVWLQPKPRKFSGRTGSSKSELANNFNDAADTLRDGARVDPTVTLPGQLDEADRPRVVPVLTIDTKDAALKVIQYEGNGARDTEETCQLVPVSPPGPKPDDARKKVLKLNEVLRSMRTAPIHKHSEELEDLPVLDRASTTIGARIDVDDSVADDEAVSKASLDTRMVKQPSTTTIATPIKSARDAFLMRANTKEVGGKQASRHNVLGDDGHELGNSMAEKIVKSNQFEYFVLILITANAIFIGALTNSIASGDSERELTILEEVVEKVFLTLFAAELILRIFVYRKWFFKCTTPGGGRNYQIVWNIFDFGIVSFSTLDAILQHVPVLNKASIFDKISVLRLLRLLRIFRILRIGKLLKFVRSMHLILMSISQCLGLFFWSVMCLFFWTYMVAVYFTEAVLQVRFADDQTTPLNHDAELDLHFGTVADSWLSLIKAVTGGIDWGDLTNCLRDLPFFVGLVPFLIYVLFSLLAIMNVITGIFLETATDRAKHEKEIWLLRSARSIFKAADSTQDGKITLKDFMLKLSHQDVAQFFDAIDLDVQQAPILFELLDFSGDGFISSDEFLRGCLRLRGSAKALDLLILSREVTQLIEWTVGTINNLGSTNKAYAEIMAQNKERILDNHQMLGEIHDRLISFEKLQSSGITMVSSPSDGRR